MRFGRRTEMKQCGECGFPEWFAGLFEWRSDGTILMNQRGALLQLALIDADELQALFDNLSETIGFSVDHIANAYNQTLYAARIAAALEARTGKPTEITWKQRDKDSAAFMIVEAP